LPDTKFGRFSQSLMDEAKKNDWVVISMKNYWKQIFTFKAKEGRGDVKPIENSKLGRRNVNGELTIAAALSGLVLRCNQKEPLF
jgi:hypothetical protein